MYTLYSCTFDNIFWLFNLEILTSSTIDYIVKFGCYLISFLYIWNLHIDCSHIEDVHPRRRSRVEFCLVVTFPCGVLGQVGAWLYRFLIFVSYLTLLHVWKCNLYQCKPAKTWFFPTEISMYIRPSIHCFSFNGIFFLLYSFSLSPTYWISIEMHVQRANNQEF